MSKRTIAVAALAVESVILGAVGLVALDLRAHHHVEELGGVNVWGYRGGVLRQKRANETRLALVGGDLAFGWGVAANETMPYYLRRLVALDVDRPGQPPRIVTAVNLSAQGLLPSEYDAWIDHFAYLRPDVICILPDPPQHRLRSGRFLPDRRSAFFTTFGYSPILPLVVKEKGDVVDSALLRGAGAWLARADLERPAPREAGSGRVLDAAVRAALRTAPAGVVVVLPPDSDADPAGIAVGDRRLRVVDLNHATHPYDSALTLDGFHFGAGGHSWAADVVAPSVLGLLR
jgi:hypothetical protein